ncbi:MAG: hypothetical protein ABIK97_00440 [candidate division WOR-3 bacterium]
MKEEKGKKKINLLLRFDKGITEDEINSIKNGVEIFTKMFEGVSYRVYPASDEKSYKIFEIAKNKLKKGKQLEVATASFSPLLKEDPFKKRREGSISYVESNRDIPLFVYSAGFPIFVFNEDITVENIGFIIGIGCWGSYTIISPIRFRELNKELKDLCLKVQLWHEIGHLFGAPDLSRAINKLGPHDPDEIICVMRQGIKVPEDWIRFAEDYKREDIIYCDWCKKVIRKNLKQRL